MNEAETRAEHIDPALQAAGWGVVEGSRIRREYPIMLERRSGWRGQPLTADYVLEYRDTKLAVFPPSVASDSEHVERSAARCFANYCVPTRRQLVRPPAIAGRAPDRAAYFSRADRGLAGRSTE